MFRGETEHIPRVVFITQKFFCGVGLVSPQKLNQALGISPEKITPPTILSLD